jgi:predicted neutral ceramidase superfamily lipid hydrolase
MPILALLSQVLVHSFFGLIWEDNRLHWRHWSERFSFLPALWIALPFLLWFLVSAQSQKSIIEPFFVGVVVLGLLLYVMGLFRAFYRYVKEANAPWYLAILYLCTLEASPIFWILVFQSYEG